MVDATQQAQGADNKGTHSCPMLVLGVGNILLRDEGIGVRVVEAMQKLDLPPEVELFDGATAGMDLLNVLADRRKVIVIDAIEGDYEPGTVLRLRRRIWPPRVRRAYPCMKRGCWTCCRWLSC